jgi:hypothetical protein
LASAPSRLLAREQTSSFDGLEQRLAEAIAAYDAQGNHRTATAADSASAEWLARQIQQSDVQPTLESFTLSRIQWLKAHAQVRTEISLVAQVGRMTTNAVNVTARIAGSNPGLAPLVVTTPRSGWWECASERGGGLACWLETIRTLAAAAPARDCLFAAFSGHEIGFLGIDAYLASRPDLAKRAHAWIHLGANIGAPQQPNQVHVSDPSLEGWITAALQKEGLSIDHKAEAGSVPRGEAGTIHRGGAGYVALVCGTEVFHNTADRWPDAVDVTMVARYARSFATGALELALQRS